ncbi:hypothetical protein RHSIM_Rhsim10G0213100 [Rhododendron simsii]|uniref:Uncharacterized protein n=1 Tax=Rhododendron simsii TaxID=118357 RepID=A0A834GFN3_RHOSS|nr:hypothetical protein RHSIM_Rhsim10G0213100 [Rhododendron simsii]
MTTISFHVTGGSWNLPRKAGPHPWAVENFAMVAKYSSNPCTVLQDLYFSGAVKSATAFLVYKELAGLFGLDFAYADRTAVYHIKGSLQHLGENMLAFLLHTAASSPIPNDKAIVADQKAGQDTAKGELSQVVQADLAKLDAERWLFRAGLAQWFFVLMIGNYYKIGTSYLARVASLTCLCIWLA